MTIASGEVVTSGIFRPLDDTPGICCSATEKSSSAGVRHRSTRTNMAGDFSHHSPDDTT